MALSFGLPLWMPRFRRDQLLIEEYQRFFGQQRRDTDLKALKPESGPRIHLLATSLTTGERCDFCAEGFIRFDSRSAGQPLQSARFNIPLAVAASSAFPALFPPVRISAARFNLSLKDFGGIDVDYLTDGGVSDNLGLRAATDEYVIKFLSQKQIHVSDASASFKWNTRQKFSTIVGRTARTIDVLMGRVAELEVDLEMAVLSAARLAMEKKNVESERNVLWSRLDGPRLGESPEILRPGDTPNIQVIGINGRGEASSYRELDVDIGTGFYGFRNRLVGIDDDIRRSEDKAWAVAMSSMRTDLDKFSSEECRFLENWGYEQASAIWSPPPSFGPPGSRPPSLAPKPTPTQLIGMEGAAKRTLGLIAPREAVGKALLFVWTLYIAAVLRLAWLLWT